MNTSYLFRSAAVVAVALASATSAYAQDAAASACVDDDANGVCDSEETGAQIIVTGSRISRPNLDSPVPITSVTAEELTQTGNTSVGDLLNDLPALRSTYSQQNSSRFLGTAGLNLLDLRGLGTQRTLVVVNGRRHVGADILGNAVSPDVNTFPTDLIERVDIVTGGSSAVYGSDAIAGVVNFVLKRNFQGIQLRAQGGVSKYGDAGNYFVSGVAGTNFADDRGNVAVNVEYARQNPYFASNRPNVRNNNGFVVVDTDPSGSDGVVDRVFVKDIRAATFSQGGLFQISPATGFAPCGRDPFGVAYRCTLQFQQDGTLVPQTGTRIGLAPNGSFVGGNGSNNREGNLLAMQPTLDRISVNLLGHFQISDMVEPFVEAKYVRTDSLSYGSPAFFQGGTIDGFYERPRFDNPFLSDAARTQLNATRVAAGLAPITNGATRISLFRTLGDLGPRQEEATRETYRIVAGLRGTADNGWTYELAANYGEFQERTKVLGNLNMQRFILAMDSTRNASNQIVCRSQIDPTAANIYPYGNDEDYATAALAGDVSACVPLNPFGAGNITQEMRNYLLQDTTSVGSIKQFVLSGYVSGDTSQWFELPGGPIGISLGAEYRRETNYFKTDDLVASGLTFYNALPLFDPPAFEVTEAFGEVRLPLLADIPFIQELTVTGAGRVSKYKGKTGRVFAYNGGVEWRPVSDLRLRAAYARSVRAPNLADLYSEQSQNFAPGFSDPCSARNIGTGSSTRVANCAAAGIPTSYDYVYNSSLEILSGGNPDLNEEKSDSITIGGVFQPSFIPGLSISADYFEIKIKDVITAPSAQQIANACYDAVNLQNQFCGLFQRAGAAGGPRGEIQYQILEGNMQQTLLNYAQRKTRGLDAELNYRGELPIEGGRFSTRVAYTHLFQLDFFENPADPGRANQVLLELGDPQDSLNFNADFELNNLMLGFQFRYVGKQVLNTYEDFFEVQGRPPENADYAAVKFYPSQFYQDFRIGWKIEGGSEFYAGVDNVFNVMPPYGLTGTGGGSGIYDARGRYFYAGVKAKF